MKKDKFVATFELDLSGKIDPVECESMLHTELLAMKELLMVEIRKHLNER